MPHLTQNIISFGLVWKKLNLTQQKHAFTNRKKCTTTQNKHKPGLFSKEKISKGGDEEKVKKKG